MNTILQESDDTTLDQLSTLQLPALPAGAPYLLKSLTDENIEFTELAGVIEKFPGIAGKLLSLVNSAWSAPSSEVTSLEDACSRLGLSVVRSTSIALAVAAPFNSAACPAFDLETYWCGVLLTADTASRLVGVSSPAHEYEPATLRAAGLLHNLGLLWLVDRLPAETDRALTLVGNEQAETLQQAFDDILGFNHLAAGEHLGTSWDLPRALVVAMAHAPEVDYQGDFREIVLTVGLAAKLASAALDDADCPGQDLRQSSLGISDDSLARIFSQTHAQLARTREIARVLI